MTIKILRKGDVVVVYECGKTERKVAEIASNEEATIDLENRVSTVTYTKKMP
jgi:nucleoside-triphosphatase THEP1